MRNLLLLLSLTFALVLSAEVSSRLLLQQEESRDMEIGDIPGLGLVAYLGGDSLILLESPDLDIVHLPAMNDARQILITDSALYCAVGNYICRLDTATSTLKDVMILDNEDFTLYPASGNSFFALTTDEEWSSCILVDPDNNTYSETLEYPGPIRKVAASREHCFVWIDDCVCLVGEEGQLATLFCEPSLRDITLTPSGLVAATDDGVWVVAAPSRIWRISEEKIDRLWYTDSSLYLLHENGMLVALDDFTYPPEE